MRIIFVPTLVAATLCYMLNTAMLYRVGSVGRSLATPLVEELLKTGLALFFRSSIVPVHIGFGIIEGILEWRRAEVRAPAIFGASILSHSLFGLLTVVIYDTVGWVWAGVSAAVLLHVFWNAAVFDLTRMPGRR